jgi:endonuclease/exonuclease/phosphatase family metal-dependent hydrolase
MNLAFFLHDLIAFLKQLIPSPINFFNSYYFSPSDLPQTVANVDGDDDYATIDVLTYNINNVAIKCCNRRRRIRHSICSSGADIVLLQETNPAWEEYLLQEENESESRIATQYNHCYFHHPEITDRAAGGIAILSRYPLLDNNAHILNFTTNVNGSVFPALICSIHNIPLGKYYNVTINIANVHLRPPVELDGTAKLDTARITEPVRLHEVKELIRRSSTACYYNTSFSSSNSTMTTNQNNSRQYNLDIIAGDFNEGDDATALTYLTKTLGYNNALQTHVPTRKETHTWPFICIHNNNNWYVVLRKRLDHILWHNRPILTVMSNNNNNVIGSDVVMEEYSARLQCIGCGVMTGYEDGASDHQPVLSRFVIIAKKTDIDWTGSLSPNKNRNTMHDYINS